MAEVVAAQQFHHLLDAHAPFGGHELGAQGVGGGVEADGDVAIALLEESFQLVFHADAAHRDALRAPGPAIVGSENLRGPQHVVEVVHRLALSHEDDVGEAVALGQRVDLVEDVIGREVALEALLAGLAEEAVHLASHLRRDAERGPAALFGDEDGLDHLSSARRLSSLHGEEVFRRAVLGALGVDGAGPADLAMLGQESAVGFRDVGHLVDARGVSPINPFGDLLAGKPGQPQLHGYVAELIYSET